MARAWRCYGRKINQAEHPLAFIQMLRLITDGRISPEEAVRAYHGVLQGKNIQPKIAAGKGLGANRPVYELRRGGRQSRECVNKKQPSGRARRRRRCQRGS